MRPVCILFISESLRKAGDPNDPYRMFAKLTATGELDEHFQQLGLKRTTPNRLIQ
jgi:hypothetical protein